MHLAPRGLTFSIVCTVVGHLLRVHISPKHALLAAQVPWCASVGYGMVGGGVSPSS